MNRDALTTPLLDASPAADTFRHGFELPARAESVSRARRRVGEVLHRWGVTGDDRETVLLVVSELVTNAVVHTGGHLVSCLLHRTADRLRVTVHDQGSGPSGPRVCRDAQGERGRGLLLVEAVSLAWGSYDGERGAGRSVWCELPLHADAFPAEEPGSGPLGAAWPC
ncbi:ATP-binding protein [Streptomyces sp. NPDC006984]|uniref:ATP-binding protein n=1 Tax=Streptomyces sp. NPDC006984 TaxID=3155463 RepID=UPI0033EC0418